jgi:hypothetical protein
LNAYLNLTMDVGLLCHMGKLVPPNTIVQYSGFLYDMTTESFLRIPVAKREKILTMLEYILQYKEHSRLVLSVLAGLLESVTPAMNSSIG